VITGGEKGIRTPGELAPTPDFESIRVVAARRGVKHMPKSMSVPRPTGTCTACITADRKFTPMRLAVPARRTKSTIDPVPLGSRCRLGAGHRNTVRPTNSNVGTKEPAS